MQHFVGKLLADLMGLFRRGLAGGKGLDQVVGQIVAFLDGLRQQHFKFYVRCFIGTAKKEDTSILSSVLSGFSM